MAKNIRFQGLIKTTAELESDKFAGRIGWNSTLARFVAYYSSTLYAQMARRDVLETFAAGIQDSTLGVGLPMFGGAGGRLSTESVASFRTRIGAVNIAGDVMTGGLTLSAGDLNVGAGAIQTAGVTRISSDGAGTLSTLSTKGLADLASARVQSLTASQMAATDGAKNLVSWDAETARTNLGIVRDWGNASGGVSTWIKIVQMRIASQYGSASFSARATDIGVSGAGDYGTLDVVGRIRQKSPMSSPLDYVNLIVSRQGSTEMMLGYVVDVDNSTEKIVSVYVALAGYRGAIASGIASFGELSFLSGQPLLTSAPAGYVPATRAASTVGSFSATSVNISGLTGARMLSLDASKNVVSLDAAGSRALIGAASSAGSVSYATLFTGRRTVTGLTNGVTGTLIPSYTVAANGWAVGMRLLFEFNLFTVRDGQVDVKIGGNTIASYGLGTVTRSIFRIELVCLSTGATARFAYAASAYDPATSTATTQTIIGDSQASVDSVGDNWSVDTTASTSIAFEYTPSTGSQNVVVHSASVQTCTP